MKKFHTAVPFYEVSDHTLISVQLSVQTIGIKMPKEMNDLLETVFVTNTKTLS
jgi:phage-related holin